MKPTSQPSFTSRPIHQSLLYFCEQETKRETGGKHSYRPALPVDGALKLALPPAPPASTSDESLLISKTMPRLGPSLTMDHPLLERREEHSLLPP